LVTPDVAAKIPIASEWEKEAQYVQWGGFTLGEEDPRLGQFVVHDQEICAVPIIGVDDAVTVDIRTLTVDRGSPNKSEVHVEPNAGLVDFRSDSSSCTFTDPGLFLPVDVSERMKLEAIREAVRAGS